MKKTLLFIVICLLGIGLISAQTTVFSDNFSTNQSSAWTTGGQIGSSAFFVDRSGVDWGARRHTNGILELTNDASAAGNVNGWVFAHTSTASFSSPYNTILSSNAGVVTWYFNMRQIRTDPAGFAAGNYGVAFILAGSSTTAWNAGTGYAVVLGQSLATDPIRLAKYGAGLSSGLTNIITSNTSGLTDFGNEYVSVKVTYDPVGNIWELFLRNDGASAFADPRSGTLTSQGTAIDNSYVSTSLGHLGCYWQGSTAANQVASFDNITVLATEPAGGDPLISVAGIPLDNFGGVLVGAASASQIYTVSGSDLDAGIVISAPIGFEISLNGSNWYVELTLTQSGGNVAETDVYVRFVPGAAQAYSGNISHTSTNATTVNVGVAGTGLKAEPTNHATNFAAGAGGDPLYDITVTWTDATGGVVPDGYLIKASTVGYGSIVDPVDGTPEADGTFVRNVAAGIQTHTFTNLNSGTTHYFKIYPYTNSGSFINYKTDGTVPAASHATAEGPKIVEVVMPRYMQGLNGTNNQRIPWASRLTLENLTPGATYRYFGMFVLSTDSPTTNGAGIGWFVTSDGIFSRSTTLGMTTAGQYGEFTTNANGDFTGWFVGEPSGNVRFTPGNEVYYRIMLNNGAGGTTVTLRLTTGNSIRVINFGNTANVNQGTFLYGTSYAPPKNFVFVYDNELGTGRPISGTVVESDGLDLSAVTQILPRYRNNVDGINGAWGVIIPNSTGSKGFSGIKRVESRFLLTGQVHKYSTSDDGIWPSGANTVNPTGGDTSPIVMDETDAPLPVVLSSFTATISAQNFVRLQWITQSETNCAGYYIYRGRNGNLSEAIRLEGFVTASNTSQQQVYIYDDREIYEDGTYLYWLESVDFDGITYYHGPISISVTFGGDDNPTPNIPLVNALNSVFPNPFNPSAFITYSIAAPTQVQISIFNSRGQLVRTLLKGDKGIGNHRIEWNGKDDNGNNCSTGIYYIRLTAGRDSFVRKAVLVK